MKRFTRRAFLRGSGVVVGLPWLASLASSAPRAFAQAGPPQRLCLWTWPNGMVDGAWAPSSDESGRITTLSPVLQPLANLVDSLLPVVGLRLGSALAPEADAAGHPRGAGALLTGGHLGGADSRGVRRSSHASIDQVLLARLSPPTRFGTLLLQVGRAPPSDATSVFRSADGLPLAPNPDPWDVHRQLFSVGGAEPSLLLSTRRSVLDAVMEEYRQLRCQVGSEDRQILEQHLESIRAVERRLAAPLQASAACVAPDMAADPGGRYTSHNDSFAELGALQIDLLLLALACDASRISALQWGAPGAGQVFSWLGHSRGHHSLSHDNTAEADGQLLEIYRWYSSQLARFLEGARSIAEADGTSLLDNLLLCATTEISTGWNHSVDDVPFLLAGGAGGALRTGRLLSFPGENHGRLLLSLCHTMGTPLDAFGDPRYCDKGPLTGLS